MKTFKEDIYRQVLLDPAAISTGNSAWVDLSAAHSAEFFLAIGATDGVVDMKLQEAQDASGTGAKDITGAVITQLSATDDNQQAAIEINGAKLSDGFRFVRAVVTIAGNTTGCLIANIAKQSKPVAQHADFVEQILLVD